MLLLLAVSVPPALAQKPDSARAVQDSLAARLERAEEAIELLKQQLAAQSESGATTRSGMKLEFSGRVLVSAFGNSRETNNPDVPQFVLPDAASELPHGGAGIAIRQTMLGIAVTANSVWGAEFRGDADADFFGAQQPNASPLLRLRTARAILTWKHAALVLGQESPLVSGLNPVSLAGVGTPDFAGSGNLWSWLPQLRASVESGSDLRVAVEGALLAPVTADAGYAGYGADPATTEYANAAERSRRPFVEGRLRLRWGTDETPGEVGVGVHRGWFANSASTLLTGDGIMADARVPLGASFEFRGEAYDGRGLSSLGGGQIGQLIGRNDQLVRGWGAWGQLNAKPTRRIIVGAGYGIDDPKNVDLDPTARLKNTTGEVHVIVRGAGPMVCSAEWRQTTTAYWARSWTNDHLNVGVGFEF